MTIEAHFPEISLRDACRVASENGRGCHPRTRFSSSSKGQQEARSAGVTKGSKWGKGRLAMAPQGKWQPTQARQCSSSSHTQQGAPRGAGAEDTWQLEAKAPRPPDSSWGQSKGLHCSCSPRPLRDAPLMCQGGEWPTAPARSCLPVSATPGISDLTRVI